MIPVNRNNYNNKVNKLSIKGKRVSCGQDNFVYSGWSLYTKSLALLFLDFAFSRTHALTSADLRV